MQRCWQREKPLSPGAQEQCAPGYGMQAGAVEPEVPAIQRLGTGVGPQLLPVSASENLIAHTPLALGNFHSWSIIHIGPIPFRCEGSRGGFFLIDFFDKNKVQTWQYISENFS